MKSHEINENVHKKCVRFFLGNASDFKRFLHLTLSISNTGNIRWQYQAISKLIAQFFGLANLMTGNLFPSIVY